MDAHQTHPPLRFEQFRQLGSRHLGPGAQLLCREVERLKAIERVAWRHLDALPPEARAEIEEALCGRPRGTWLHGIERPGLRGRQKMEPRETIGERAARERAERA